VVGSVHSSFGMSSEEMTARVIRAVRHPPLTILGHPTGRLLLTRAGYAIDLEAVIDAAAEAGVAIEINANPHRLDLDWREVRHAAERGVLIAINPDAHSTAGLEHVAYGVNMARKAGLGPERILNCWTDERGGAVLCRPKAGALGASGRARSCAAWERCTRTAAAPSTTDGPFQLLVATVLSAQCTDARVNQVTPALFARYPDPAELAGHPGGGGGGDPLGQLLPQQGEGAGRTGSPARWSRSTAARSRAIEALQRLPGVGRKTANVVRGVAFGEADGVVVDTHVKRVALRLGLTAADRPGTRGARPAPAPPARERVVFTHRVIDHGRAVCVARTPRCGESARSLALCPSALGRRRPDMTGRILMPDMRNPASRKS
jgi:endonuclease III